ncbi:MAG TPA: CAP domain-containing protein [Gemmataceae bacterium]|jgi:uncharacterized protein YkwD|nr:CAP domain-containing protein [Gemmataceae bacterium]
MIGCPHCKKTLRASGDIVGRKVTCPACRRAFVAGPAAADASAVPGAMSGPRWFYAQDRQRKGPVTLAELANLVRRGELTREAMVLAEGEQKWRPVGTVKGLFRTSGGSEAGAASRATPRRRVEKGEEPLAQEVGDGSGDPSYGKSGWLPVALGVGGAGMVAVVAAIVWVMIPPAAPKVDDSPTHPIANVAPKPSVPMNPIAPPLAKPAEPRAEAVALQDIDVPNLTAALLGRLNAERKALGLGSVVVDPELSAGCESHAKYAARNLELPGFAAAGGLRGETPSLSGASDAGRAAATVSVQSPQEPTRAFAIWWGRLSSRLRFVEPDLMRIGVGIARNHRGDWVTVVDPLRGLGKETVAYPAPGQKGVPLGFGGGLQGKNAGYPISLEFPPETVLADVVAVLTDEAGNRISSLVSTPAMPLPGVSSKTMVGLLPKSPLKGQTPYRVRISARVDDRPFEKSWEFTTVDDADADGQWAKLVLERINAFRRRAGQEPVTLDANLSVGCGNHARYLALNLHHPATQGLGGHKEDASLAGATPQGAKAGLAADIALGVALPTAAVDGWGATLYHRVPLLDPRLKRIGFGCARSEGFRWITVVDVATGKDQRPLPGPIAYPVDGQQEVPLEFPPGGEIPDPIPENKTGRAGYPITITFPVESPLTGATGVVEDEQGAVVPCWFSSPERPANPELPKKRQGTTVCLIPKTPLEPEKTYKVRVAGRLAEVPWQKSWRFRTAGAGMSPEEATRGVAERLSAVRHAVGLPAVVVDAELSKGCRAHAEYLIRNADLRKQADFSLVGERHERPGYSAEGERASNRSEAFFDATPPTKQIDDLLASLSQRSKLLDPRLVRIGVGCAFEAGVGWTCTLDLQSGLAEPAPIAVPSAAARNVPTDGFDRIPDNDTSGGFPISVLFRPGQKIRAVHGTLTDSSDNAVDTFLSSPEGPLSKNIAEPVIALHPRRALRAGETYTVTLQAVVDGRPWRQSWRFETAP